MKNIIHSNIGKNFTIQTNTTGLNNDTNISLDLQKRTFFKLKKKLLTSGNSYGPMGLDKLPLN